jgi:hypothetical protein
LDFLTAPDIRAEGASNHCNSYPDMIKSVNLGASGLWAGPGYPLVSFLPGGKKGYRFYPLRFAV